MALLGIGRGTGSCLKSCGSASCFESSARNTLKLGVLWLEGFLLFRVTDGFGESLLALANVLRGLCTRNQSEYASSIAGIVRFPVLTMMEHLFRLTVPR